VRSIPDVPPLGANQSLFIDVPGIVPTSPRAAEELDAALAALFTTARVIVINAAYEVELIKRAFEFAARAGCTHVAFTHLDEVPQWGKLWEFLLASELTPLFLATGPNIAGEIEEHVFDGVLARTFPAPSSASEDARRTESQPRPPVANRQPPQAGRPFRYPGPQAAESLATS
jgi:flagellar biosynthesis GTPase FlhF